MELSRKPSCLDAVDKNLDVDSWFDAASRVCHPGSKRIGDVVSVLLTRNGPVTIDIAERLSSTCWTAYADVDRRALPISVDIVDSFGLVQSLGELSATRNIIPAFGPFCALRSKFAKLRFRTGAGTDNKISLTFYSPS